MGFCLFFVCFYNSTSEIEPSTSTQLFTLVKFKASPNFTQLFKFLKKTYEGLGL